MAGIAAALAVTRLPGLKWFDGLLAAFAVWYTIGCWTKASARMRAIAAEGSLCPGRWESWLWVVLGFIGPMVVCLGTGLYLAEGGSLDEFQFEDFHHNQALRFLSAGLIFLPVLMTSPSLLRASAGHSGRAAVLRAIAGMTIGGVLAIMTTLSLVGITFLVHVAIHGVRQAQRYRPEGDQFGPRVFFASDCWEFYWGAALAFVLWLIAGALLRGFAQAAPGSLWGRAAGLLVGALVAIVGALIFAGYQVFDSHLSPILSRFIWADRPEVLWWLGLAFLAVAAGWTTQWLLTASPAESRELPSPGPSISSLDQSLFVLALPILWFGFAVLASVTQQFQFGIWQTIRNLPLLLIEDVAAIFCLALFISWIRTAWSRWKGYDTQRVEMNVASPTRLVAVWVGSLGLLAVAGPVWAWLGFALWTWPRP